MFGDLFGEDSDPVGSGSPELAISISETVPQRTVSNDKSSEQRAVLSARRPASRLCGIRNQGATCYLNTLIQTLAMTPEFRGI